MTDENQRERDQMWKRIDQHGKRLGELEQSTVRLETQNTEHSRQLSDLAQATLSLNQSMSQLIGGMRSLRWIGIGLGLLIAIVQIADAIGSIG